jgi:hypothetical protein
MATIRRVNDREVAESLPEANLRIEISGGEKIFMDESEHSDPFSRVST